MVERTISYLLNKKHQIGCCSSFGIILTDKISSAALSESRETIHSYMAGHNAGKPGPPWMREWAILRPASSTELSSAQFFFGSWLCDGPSKSRSLASKRRDSKKSWRNAPASIPSSSWNSTERRQQKRLDSRITLAFL